MQLTAIAAAASALSLIVIVKLGAGAAPACPAWAGPPPRVTVGGERSSTVQLKRLGADALPAASCAVTVTEKLSEALCEESAIVTLPSGLSVPHAADWLGGGLASRSTQVYVICAAALTL